MDILIDIKLKTELLLKLAEQHQAEIKCNKEYCEQRIIWQNGEIVRYEKLEKFQ
jgi:hypothetical protein